MVITLFLVLSIVSFPTTIFSESTDLIPNTYYDAAQIFISSTAETDGFTMSPAQNKAYCELGDNIFGVPEEQDDGNCSLPVKNMVTNWNSSTTKSFSINVTSA